MKERNRVRDIILILIGACILQFFEGLAIYQIAYENGKKAKYPDYLVLYTACYQSWEIPVGKEVYKVSCVRIK